MTPSAHPIPQYLHLLLCLTLASPQQICQNSWTKHLDLEKGGENNRRGNQKNNWKGNQKVWHSFQPGPIGICGAGLKHRIRKRWTFSLQLNWENRPEEKEKEEKSRQMHGSLKDSSCRAGARCGWMDFGSVFTCPSDAFTQEQAELFDCSSENK